MFLAGIVSEVKAETFEAVERNSALCVDAKLDGRLAVRTAIASVPPHKTEIFVIDLDLVVGTLNHEASVHAAAQVGDVQGIDAETVDGDGCRTDDHAFAARVQGRNQSRSQTECTDAGQPRSGLNEPDKAHGCAEQRYQGGKVFLEELHWGVAERHAFRTAATE